MNTKLDAARPENGSRRSRGGLSRAAVISAIRSAGGIGWTPFLFAAGFAVMLRYLAQGFEEIEGDRPPGPAGGYVTPAVVESLHRVILAANAFITPFVGLMMVAGVVGVIVVLAISTRQGTPVTAVMRMARHSFGEIIRVFVPIPAMVAFYAAINGHWPAAGIVVVILLLISTSWDCPHFG